MRRIMKVVLSFAMIIAMLTTNLTAFAADEFTVASKSSSVSNNAAGNATIKSFKSIKKLTVYADDANPVVNVTYKWVKAAGADERAGAGIVVGTSDRSIVKVVGTVSSNTVKGKTDKKGRTKMTTTETVSLNAVGNGTAVITIKDKFNAKKTKKIKVVVKTHVNSIEAKNATVSENGVANMCIAGTKGATLDMGIVVNGDATNKKLTYSVEPAAGLKGYFKASKGQIKIKKNVTTGDAPVLLGKVWVAAKDGNAALKYDKKNKNKGYAVNVYAIPAKVTDKLKAESDTNSKKDLGLLYKGKSINLKKNVESPYHTYTLKFDSVSNNKLSFVSTNTKVAKVDANGKITAAGNGKAKIVVTPKEGNKNKVTIKVNVTTDADIITLPNGNKFTITADKKDKAFIDARLNQGAKGKIKYEIVSVTDKSGNAVSSKAVKVSKKGVVKASTPCVATIRAYAKNNTAVDTTVTVTAVAPVKTISMNAVSVTVSGNDVTTGAAVKGNKATLMIMGDGYKTVKLNTTVSGNSATAVKYTSSKPAVARVTDDGLIIPVKSGKAVITAKANDTTGKKMKFKVTVKTAAYQINVPGAEYLGKSVSDNSTDVFRLAVKQAKSYTSSKVIKAFTNPNASNKKVTYSTKKISFTDGKATVTVKTKDGISKAIVELVLIPNDKIATKENVIETVSYNGVYGDAVQQAADGIKVYAGSKVALAANCVAVGTDKVVLDTKTIWKSENRKVAKVNKSGIVKAVKPGVAVITAKNKKTGAEASIKVYVGAKKAVVQKEYNKIITSVLKEENRNWMGAATKFNSKTNKFDVDILSYDRDIKTIQDSGVTELAKSLYNDVNCKPVSIKACDNAGNYAILGKDGQTEEIGYKDYKFTITRDASVAFNKDNATAYVHQEPRVDGVTGTFDWTIVKASNIVTASRNDGITFIINIDTHTLTIDGSDIVDAGVYNSADEAAKAVLDVLGYRDDFDFYRMLANWNGFSANADMTVQYTVNGVAMDYTFNYAVAVTMSDKVYDAMMDARIQDAIKNVEANMDESLAIDTELTQYIADKNELEIVANKNVAVDADFFAGLKDSFNKSVENDDAASKSLDIFFADVKEIKYTVRTADDDDINVKVKSGVKTKGSKAPSEFFNEVFDAYANDVLDLGIKDYNGLNNVISGFYVTCQVGDSEYTIYYETRFLLDRSARPVVSDNSL